jgi:hypothetical protein
MSRRVYTYRCAVDLKSAAAYAASVQGVPLASVIRRALVDFLAEHDPDAYEDLLTATGAIGRDSLAAATASEIPDR